MKMARLSVVGIMMMMMICGTDARRITHVNFAGCDEECGKCFLNCFYKLPSLNDPISIQRCYERCSTEIAPAPAPAAQDEVDTLNI